MGRRHPSSPCPSRTMHRLHRGADARPADAGRPPDRADPPGHAAGHQHLSEERWARLHVRDPPDDPRRDLDRGDPGGVNIVINSPPPIGTVDISADSAIIWRKVDPEKGAKGIGPDGELIESSRQPMEVYLEGHVVFRQDERVAAGNGDQKTYRAERVFFNVQSDRLVAINAELDMFAPGLIAPVNMKSPRIEQYRPLERAADGKLIYGFQDIHADRTVLTGSRFPNPGYRFTSRSVDIRRVVSDQADPNTGRTVGESGRSRDRRRT